MSDVCKVSWTTLLQNHFPNRGQRLSVTAGSQNWRQQINRKLHTTSPIIHQHHRSFYKN